MVETTFTGTSIGRQFCGLDKKLVSKNPALLVTKAKASRAEVTSDAVRRLQNEFSIVRRPKPSLALPYTSAGIPLSAAHALASSISIPVFSSKKKLRPASARSTSQDDLSTTPQGRRGTTVGILGRRGSSIGMDVGGHPAFPTSPKTLNLKRSIVTIPVDILQCPLRQYVPNKSQSPHLHHVHKGYEEQLKGNMQAAGRLFTRAIQQDPRSFIPYVCRAMLLEGTGKLYNSLEDLNQAIKLIKRTKTTHQDHQILLDDTNLVYFNRAVIFTRLGDDKLAVADLSLAIKVVPSDVDAIKNKALILRRNGHFLEARNGHTARPFCYL
jgi:tetratricopeptide (TPR) repeat protein